MSEAIANFDDYVSHLTKKLRSLRHLERCLFSAWCSEHLLESHANQIEETFSSADLQALREILDVIWEFLLDGSIPKGDVLTELDNQFMRIEVDDPFDVDPVVSLVQSAIGICILGCRRNDVRLAQKSAETDIDVLDYEMDEQDPDYSTNARNEVFEYPEMKRELTVQLKMLQHLRREYALDDSLRSAFRR